MGQICSKSNQQPHHDWGYEGENGPQNWSKSFASAAGYHQSPINIVDELAVYDRDLLRRPLEIDYDKYSCYRIQNTGHGFQIDAHDQNLSRLRGGPLVHEYKFLQFHMHWGESVHQGSEHLVDGQSYAAEIHFVNWNHQAYQTPKLASASNNHDGLAVLGVFVKLGKFNPEFEKISSRIYDVHLMNKNAPITQINLFNLLPENMNDYWTYNGSLTTPPCSECVQWIVLKEPIEISKEQLFKCHNLYHASQEKLCNDKTAIKKNDRPVCALNDRVVYKTFDTPTLVSRF